MEKKMSMEDYDAVRDAWKALRLIEKAKEDELFQHKAVFQYPLIIKKELMKIKQFLEKVLGLPVMKTIENILKNNHNSDGELEGSFETHLDDDDYCYLAWSQIGKRKNVFYNFLSSKTSEEDLELCADFYNAFSTVEFSNIEEDAGEEEEDEEVQEKPKKKKKRSLVGEFIKKL
jgi:hypothetical protein